MPPSKGLDSLPFLRPKLLLGLPTGSTQLAAVGNRCPQRGPRAPVSQQAEGGREWEAGLEEQMQGIRPPEGAWPTNHLLSGLPSSFRPSPVSRQPSSGVSSLGSVSLPRANITLNRPLWLCSVVILTRSPSHPAQLVYRRLPSKWWASLLAQTVRSLPAMQETRFQLLTWEAPLEKEKAAHSSVLAWRIPWTEEPGGPQSMGPRRVRHDWTNQKVISMHSTWALNFYCWIN